MSWFRVDDQLAFHRKTIAAGNAAIGLWVRAGSWLAGQPGRHASEATRGVITLAELRTMGTAAQVDKLLSVGFLDRCKLDGQKACRFRDWNVYQPTPEELEAKRSDWAVRKARQRAHAAGNHDGCLPRYCDQAPTNPEESTG